MAATEFSRPCTTFDCLNYRRPLRERIEIERRRLQRANAILAALECALNNEEIEPVVAADATYVVRGLVDDAILMLDAVSLVRGQPPRPARRERAEPGQQTAEGSEQDETDDESENDDSELDEDDEPDVDEDDKD